MSVNSMLAPYKDKIVKGIYNKVWVFNQVKIINDLDIEQQKELSNLLINMKTVLDEPLNEEQQKSLNESLDYIKHLFD